ncbi:MAG: PilT/PilU family type 4a pilus ATPase [Candidatus Eremiobacteraeota bacterium]|nr:PilT/PilU family type 4a pilus ATPase [Candidatus Eremiobacteraeota bacterium]
MFEKPGSIDTGRITFRDSEEVKRLSEAETRALDAAALPEAPPDKREERFIPIPREYTLDDLFQLTSKYQASDLHITVGNPPLFRIHGQLVKTTGDPVTPEKAKELMFPLLSWDKIEKFLETGNLDFSHEAPGMGRYRANYYSDYNGLAGAFRVIPGHIPQLEDLGLPEVIKDISEFRSGLVLVTGPTCSGKSTTLAALVDHINKTRQGHIITIEDPIEFIHYNKNCLVDHREIGVHATTFADAIRAAMREDPDVLMVGEMRDLNTVYEAVRAAETGVLVLSSMHTNSASKTVDRIINMFQAGLQEQIRSMVSDSLKAVIAQILLPRIDIPGRCVAVEVMINTPSLAALLREKKTRHIPTYIQMSAQDGMQTMDMSLLELYRANKIDLGTVMENATDHSFFGEMGIKITGPER